MRKTRWIGIITSSTAATCCKAAGNNGYFEERGRVSLKNQNGFNACNNNVKEDGRFPL